VTYTPEYRVRLKHLTEDTQGYMDTKHQLKSQLKAVYAWIAEENKALHPSPFSAPTGDRSSRNK
jgi:hypothetical protein